jgi:hypothetical protein
MGPTPYYSKPACTAFTIPLSGFSSVLDTEGDYQDIITSHVTGDPDTLGAYEVVKAPTVLTITPLSVAQDFIVTIIPFNQDVALAAATPISRRHTAIGLYTQACEDTKADTSLLNHNERFMLLNRAVLSVMGQFYSLVTKDYNTRSEVTPLSVVGGTEATINVSSVPMMRLGVEARATLEMNLSDSGFAESRTEEEYLAFRSGNSRDRSLIVYVARADEFRLKKGDDVASWGSAYLWYPRIPYAFTSDTQYADFPDTLAELVTLKLSMLVASRTGKQVGDIQPILERLLSTMSGTFGANVSNEELKQKIQAAL